jgi:hypothetical protein
MAEQQDAAARLQTWAQGMAEAMNRAMVIEAERVRPIAEGPYTALASHPAFESLLAIAAAQEDSAPDGPQVGDRVTLHGTITEIRDGEAFVKIDRSTDCWKGNVWVPLDAVREERSQPGCREAPAGSAEGLSRQNEQ